MTRYFTDGTGVWKFSPGQAPMYRFLTEKGWEESAFTSLEEFQSDGTETPEIDELEGEP